MLVTSTSAEAALIEAVEGEVDGYLLKPFSAHQFLQKMDKIVRQKQNPSKYILALEVVRELLGEGELDKAEQMADKAIELSDKGCMAYALKAEICLKREDWEAALQCYDKGLELNSDHYKCLKGKFELLDRMGRHEDAYEALNFFFDKFPFKGMMIMKAMTLAVTIGRYQDLDDYYRVFENLSDRSEQLIEVVCDCLMTSGKYMLKNDRPQKAQELFLWAVNSSGRNPEVIEGVIRELAKQKDIESIKEIFQLYPNEGIGSPPYHRLNFLVASLTLPSVQVVEKGRQVVDLGAADEEVYLELIRHFVLMERTMACENLAYEAADKYPKRRTEFLTAAGIKF